MENEEVFRKVRDKLAGFESELRDDSWHLFEKYRLKKERDRKLAGVLRVGALVIFILGTLIGSWVFLESGGKLTHSGKSGIAIPKRAAERGIVTADNSISPQSHGVSFPGKVNKKAVIVGTSAKFEKANNKLPGIVPIVPRLIPLGNDSPIASSSPGSHLAEISKGLLNRGPSLYETNLQLPTIQQSEMHVAGDTGRNGRRFQLSLGPAMRANYANPSENRLTLGPAVFGTFPITARFALRGGLALMREHVYVSNTSPKFTENAVRWLNRGDYRWWDLEVPVDIQVMLYDNPRFSLSGLFGVSSSLYWGEHFKELYQKDKIITTTLALHDGEIREVQGLASKQEQPLSGRSTGIVFAPATYFSASIILEKKMTARSSVAIEPQLRYPIGGVTSRKLKFTSIGLQIRILYK